MMENYDKTYWDDKKCPPVNCKKKQCECGLEKVFLSAALGDDSKDSPIAPKNGEYCNAIVIYEANGHIYIYTAEGVPVSIGIGEDGLDIIEKELATLQQEIDDLKNSPDVVDIVPTYAALQAYDTSKLGDNDIIRVLQDETHDGQSTYYRWNATTSSWTYIGAVGAYYTKDQIDALLSNKQNVLTAGSNITISGDTISATDTTYTAGTGLTLTDTTFAIDTDVVATKSDLPTVNDATLTINQNGVNKGTFTANDADNVTVNLTDTTYTAGNAIDITSNVISADIYPADYFTAGATVTGTGSSMTLNKTIPAKLKSVELNGDTTQQTYSGKNLIDNTDLTYDFSNVSSSENHLSTLPTGIRYETTYSGSGSPVVVFKLPIDLTQYIGKTVRLRTNFGPKGKIVLVRVNSDVTSRTSLVSSETSGEVISWVVPETLGDDHFLGFNLTVVTPGGDATVDFTDLIMTIDNSDMSYEPYVGGIPAPNPDYPQDIQVVTGKQTVNVVNRNLLGYDYASLKSINSGGGRTWDDATKSMVYNGVTYKLNDDGSITANGTASGASYLVLVNSLPLRVSDSYILNGCPSGGSTSTYSIRLYDGGNYITDSGSGLNFIYGTQDVVRINVSNGTVVNNIVFKPMIRNGSDTNTTYEPHQSQSYTVDLGSTELCKIGNYQDYIYKSGDDWYVHKETNKHTFTGSENWYLQTSGTPSILYCGSGILSDAVNSAVKTQIYSDYFHYTTGAEAGGCYLYNRSVFVFYGDTSTTASTFKTWLGNNNTTVYYPLATPTDTKITDTTLIGQLDALANANSYLDATSFVVTATGTNLPAILDVSTYRNSADGIAMRNPDVPTYSDFVGTDGVTAGTHGLVPAPAITDAGKFLKADGTWDTAGGGGPTVVQTTGTSITDVMSQDATTKMVYPDIANYPNKIAINSTFSATSGLSINGKIDTNRYHNITIATDTSLPAWVGSGGRDNNILIGNNTYTNKGSYGIAIGYGTNITGVTNTSANVAIGYSANASGHDYSVALGSEAICVRDGEVNVGTGNSNHGYNSTKYRVIGGVHDGQNAHDAATVAQGNTLSTSAPDSSTEGVLGQLWTDTTNMHTYQCTAISGSTYTWQMRW